MNADAAKRSSLRWVHLILGIPIIGYIYRLRSIEVRLRQSKSGLMP